jgi:chromosome segregation ATPase
MTDDPTDKQVRYNVKMPEKLREDAKRNTDRGELSQEVRDLFRQKAYGADASEEFSELEEKKAELREVRKHIDDLRRKRAEIETEIESQETRATRLEETIDKLKQETSQLETQLEMLENMVTSGDYVWPTRIKNAADVDMSTARRLHSELQDRNPDIPDRAFEEPHFHDPDDWRNDE